LTHQPRLQPGASGMQEVRRVATEIKFLQAAIIITIIIIIIIILLLLIIIVVKAGDLSVRF
jgi:hypothetical protein